VTVYSRTIHESGLWPCSVQIEACSLYIQIRHGFANASACMKRVGIPPQKLLTSLGCIFICVAVGNVCRGAYTIAGNVVCLFASDIGLRTLALTIYGWLRLGLGLGFDQRCASQLELLFAMCGYPCQLGDKRLTPEGTTLIRKIWLARRLSKSAK
jgi:hypothetical protein